MQPIKIIAFPTVDNFKFILNKKKRMAEYDDNLKNAVDADF
jgi:hypothetical protein